MKSNYKIQISLIFFFLYTMNIASEPNQNESVIQTEPPTVKKIQPEKAEPASTDSNEKKSEPNSEDSKSKQETPKLEKETIYKTTDDNTLPYHPLKGIEGPFLEKERIFSIPVELKKDVETIDKERFLIKERIFYYKKMENSSEPKKKSNESENCDCEKSPTNPKCRCKTEPDPTPPSETPKEPTPSSSSNAIKNWNFQFAFGGGNPTFLPSQDPYASYATLFPDIGTAGVRTSYSFSNELFVSYC